MSFLKKTTKVSPCLIVNELNVSDRKSVILHRISLHWKRSSARR